MTKVRGLGRGLSALITNNVSLSGSEEVKQIPIDQLVPNKFQPRKNFKEEDIAELAESILQHGVIQPIIVSLVDDVYMIIAGERRYRAACSCGLLHMPSIVKKLSYKQVAELALIENIQRKDLSPMEESRGYKQLMTEFDYTQEVLSKIIGKSRSHIANLVRMLSLPIAVQEYIEDEQISFGHAKAIAVCDNALDLARIIVEQGLSVRQTEALVQRTNVSNQQNATKNIQRRIKTSEAMGVEKELKSAVAAIANKFNIKCNLKINDHKVEISFDNLEDLKKATNVILSMN